ncbi:MAG: kinase/pyrophosphorylase [Betaproteobacteria bacterium]|nr:kinase/pyrophosphorylase [Betaproteobacteria bacterium]
MSGVPVSRTVFYISDGTGITAEALGHSLLTQFDDALFRPPIRIPFVNSTEKAREAAARIAAEKEKSGVRPLVFSTLVSPELTEIVHNVDALCLSLIETFVAPLEAELGVRSTHTIGRSHGLTDTSDYKNRIEAINYTFAHDDGVSDGGLEEADVILVGVSRCGKTPTSLYLAMQFGLKAANFPLIPEDFERNQLPGALGSHRSKLFGLTILPERLAQIREERRPGSRYASLENCRSEVRAAERLMKREGIRWLDSSSKSIEEISTTVVQEIRVERIAPR